MKKYLFALAGLLLLNTGCSQSQEQTPVGKTPSPKFEEGTRNSLLWQITSQDMQDTSYLFGTMHLIKKEYFYFPDELKELIASTDAVVMEIAGEPNAVEAMKLMMLEEGELFDFFNEEQEDSILVWAKNSMNMEKEAFLTTFGKMKPFAVSAMASQAEMMADAESYERTITKVMKEHKIEALGLETAEEQMSIFDGFTMEEQARMVMESIKDDPEAKELTQKMQEVYRRQNIDSLQIMIHTEAGTIADKEAELLNNRNKKWIPLIEDIIAEKRAFIAVGAGHLSGDNGVIELLEKAGYTVTPIKL